MHARWKLGKIRTHKGENNYHQHYRLSEKVLTFYVNEHNHLYIYYVAIQYLQFEELNFFSFFFFWLVYCKQFMILNT